MSNGIFVPPFTGPVVAGNGSFAFFLGNFRSLGPVASLNVKHVNADLNLSKGKN